MFSLSFCETGGAPEKNPGRNTMDYYLPLAIKYYNFNVEVQLHLGKKL